MKDLLRYSVSLVTQGNHKFYTLTIPSRVLAQTCFVTNRFDDPQKGFQRILDKKRAEEIAEYIDSGFGTIPNSIVLSAQESAGLEIIGNGKTIQFKNTQKAFLILDGQHRVYGFSLATTSLRVPVVIYNNLSREDETRLFIDINTKQRPVPNELLLDIKSLAKYETTDEKLLREIFDLFNKDQDSPLVGLLSPATRTKGKISRVTFNSAFRPLIEVFSQYDAQQIYKIVSAYLNAFISGCARFEIENALAHPTFFKAIMLLFKDVAQRVKDRHGKDYRVENFNDVLKPFFSQCKKPYFDSIGNSHKELYEVFLKALRSNFNL